MADTFAYLNELNARMQGRGENFLSSKDKINGFRSRISLWRQHLERGDTLEMFPRAQKWQEQVNTSALCELIKKHLKTLEEKISFYFSSANTNSFDWVRDPYRSLVDKDTNLTFQEQEQLSPQHTSASLAFQV